jgi:hypothetical protein
MRLLSSLFFVALGVAGCGGAYQGHGPPLDFYEFRGSAEYLRGGADHFDIDDDAAFVAGDSYLLKHGTRIVFIFHGFVSQTSLLISCPEVNANKEVVVDTADVNAAHAWLVRTSKSAFEQAPNPSVIPAETASMLAVVDGRQPDPSLYFPLAGKACLRIHGMQLSELTVDLHTISPIPVYRALLEFNLEPSARGPNLGSSDEEIVREWKKNVNAPATHVAVVKGVFNLRKMDHPNDPRYRLM